MKIFVSAESWTGIQKELVELITWYCIVNELKAMIGVICSELLEHFVGSELNIFFIPLPSRISVRSTSLLVHKLSF